MLPCLKDHGQTNDVHDASQLDTTYDKQEGSGSTLKNSGLTESPKACKPIINGATMHCGVSAPTIGGAEMYRWCGSISGAEMYCWCETIMVLKCSVGADQSVVQQQQGGREQDPPSL